MLKFHPGRRKDPELREAIDRLHGEFTGIKDNDGVYFIIMRELCALSKSPFAIALELHHLDDQALLRPINTCSLRISPQGDEQWVDSQGLDLESVSLTQNSKVFYRLISESRAEVFLKHQLTDLTSLKGWPKLHSCLALPVKDAKSTRAVILLCNSPHLYQMDLFVRAQPLFITLISMLKVLANRGVDASMTPHLAIEKDTWRENFTIVEVNSPLGMITLDKKLEIIRINPMAETILKISFSDVFKKHINILFPERFPHEHATQTFAEGTNKTSIRLKATNFSGEVIPVEVTLVRFNEYFQPRILLMISDATELHAVQQNMHREIQRFRALADLAPMGILQTNGEWRTDYVNQRWLEMCGVTEEQMQGLQWCNTFHPDEAEETITELHQTLVCGAIYERECKILSSDSHQKWVKFHAQPLFDHLGKLNGFLATITDNTYFHATEEKLRRLAEEDALTKLANRSLFFSRLEHSLTRVKRQGAVALLSLDLDGFKNVNDSMGHDAGDQLLIQVAQRLQDCTREEDTISRVGGDEFNILLEGIAEASFAAQVAEKILKELAKPYTINRQEVYISASIGISFAVNGQNNSAKTLLKQSDMALYRAKAEGRNNFQYFSPELDFASKSRLELGNSLHKALQRSEFSVFYQLQAGVASNEIVGFEALLRWNHPAKGLVPPDQFLPLLEELGLINPVSRWVWHASFFQLSSWIQEGLVPSNTVMSVNLSPRQFRDSQLLSSLKNSLNDAKLNPKNVVIEITETALLLEGAEALKALQGFKALGVHIALDDFGTGYSSLSHLKKYPIDIIKIDKDFVRDILTDKDDAAIIQAVIALAKSLDLEVIAEGVETAEALKKLRELECKNYQGYLLNKPMPNTDMTNLLNDKLQNTTIVA